MTRRANTKPTSDRFSRGAIVTHKDGQKGVVWSHYAESLTQPERVMVETAWHGESSPSTAIWPVADCKVTP
jgi:hypothetical protein